MYIAVSTPGRTPLAAGCCSGRVQSAPCVHRANTPIPAFKAGAASVHGPRMQRVQGPQVGRRTTRCRSCLDSVDGGDMTIIGVEEPDDAGITSTEAMFNCINILMGVGILSIPYALKEGGWAAVGVLALMWVSTNYTGKLIVECQQYYKADDTIPKTIGMQGGVMKTYEDIAEAAFGKQGRDFMTAILYIELLGTCALFLILQKDHVQLLIEAVPWMPAAPSDTLLLAAAAAVVIPTTWLSDLSALSYVGAAGFLSALGMTGIVLYTYFTGGGAPDAVTSVIVPESLPVTFGLLAFVFAGHAVFPTIYSSIKPTQRAEFPRVLDTTYVIVGAVCLAIGTAGYAMYGSNTLEEVTGNLPPGVLRLVGTALILVSPFAKFALTLEPVAAGADAALIESRVPGAGSVLSKRVVRTGLGLSALVLATKVPFFGAFMSVLGSFLTLTVSVVFPAAAHLKLYRETLTTREQALHWGVLGLGAFATVTGTASAVTGLMHAADPAVLQVHTEAAVSQAFHLNRLVCNSLCFKVPVE